MSRENQSIAPARGDEMGRIIEDLIGTVEKEVEAFRALLGALNEQQASILDGDAEAVTRSNDRVEACVSETRHLETAWQTSSRTLSNHLDGEGSLKLSQIIPLVEDKYAGRLVELKAMLESLSEKVRHVNEKNVFLLKHSIHFVDRCLRVLTDGSAPGTPYGSDGRVASQGTSYYRGLG